MAQWSVSMEQLAAKAGADVEAVIRKATLDLFTTVVLRSPVDTGRFRANWNVSYGAPILSTTESTNKARGIEEANKALALPIGNITYMSNGLPYAERLEYGYSKQAPAGMVRVATEEFSRFIAKATK